MSMLGVKLARFWRNSTVVSLVPSSHTSPFYERLKSMARSLGLSSAYVVPAQMTPELAVQLAAVPQTFKYQLLGREVFEQLPVLGLRFASYLGRLLLLAQHTYLEVVDPDMLLASMTVLGRDDMETLSTDLQGIVHAALRAVGAVDFTVSLLHNEGACV